MSFINSTRKLFRINGGKIGCLMFFRIRGWVNLGKGFIFGSGDQICILLLCRVVEIINEKRLKICSVPVRWVWGRFLALMWSLPTQIILYLHVCTISVFSFRVDTSSYVMDYEEHRKPYNNNCVSVLKNILCVKNTKKEKS